MGQACEDTEPESDRHRRGQPRGKQAQVTVLNEGAVIIKRQNQTQPDTSDEEEEEETPQEIKEPEEPEPPPRDPLEVEEEALNEKLQTAGFFLSMPEEEQIKKRLLEIKHIRENPDWLNPENTKVKNIFLAWINCYHLACFFRILSTAKCLEKLPNLASPRKRRRRSCC